METVNVIRGTAIHFQSMDRPDDLFTTDLVAGLRDRYRFFEVPNKADEIDAEKGLLFKLGRFEKSEIEMLHLYNTALIARGPTDTETIDRFLEDVSRWASETLHVEIAAGEPVARAYLSTVEMTPSRDLSKWARGLDAIGKMLDTMVASQGFSIEPYQVTSVSMQTEREMAQPLPPGKFVFERRVDRAYDENVFFSEAPVTTADHKKLLSFFEELF